MPYSSAGPATAHGPNCDPGVRPSACRQREAKPHAGQAKELAEGAQHDDAALIDIAGEAFGARADIHEGFVDDQQAALGAQCFGQRGKPFTLERRARPDCSG